MAISVANRKRFEKLGIEFVRADVFMGEVINRVEDQQEAIEWLSEAQRKHQRGEAIRYIAMLAFTVIAAVAGCIAAWPILKEWLQVK